MTGAASTPDVELPPIDSLTIDSDFTAFLQPKVDEVLKRQALKKLFGDPRFNVMDRLDVYIDDYSKPDPLAPDVARQLVQARAILDARPTRINAQGILEDVPQSEPETAVGPVAQGAPQVEPAIADPAPPSAAALGPSAAAPAPGDEAEPSTEQAVAGNVVPESDPKSGADPR